MIEWLSNSSRSEPRYASGDDGATFIDDAPETPAPLFVVRAFKTAIFGTPKPIEYNTLQQELPQSTAPIVVKNVEVGQSGVESNLDAMRKWNKSTTTTRDNCIVRDSVSCDRQDQSTSPTKGILLTPGTAATRRKTVSFSAQKALAKRTSPDNSVRTDSKSVPSGDTGSNRPSDVPRKQSALTKTLIELSNKRSSPPVAGRKVPKPAIDNSSVERSGNDGAFEQASKSDPTIDLTLDLAQPSSRSGQHWKSEYYEFHNKSTREMRRLIQYGQNVKSYAAKKDSEAANLNEKLQKELAKVARMETKVSRMAKQLRMATEKHPHVPGEQARLVGELAQQTAMTVRYQKKAEHYQKAIGRLPSDVDVDDQTSLLDEPLVLEQKDSQDHFQATTLQVELENLQEVATTAEKKVARLEDENTRLKRSLARVKEEMATYDMKRQAKEERLKKRDERHKASKVSCEAELAKLRDEYEILLKTHHGQEHSFQPRTRLTNSQLARTDEHNVSAQHEPRALQDMIGQNPVRQASKSPRKHRPQKPVVNIWTAESVTGMPALKHNINVPNIMRDDHDVRDALQELHLNHTVSRMHPLALKIDGTSSQAIDENSGPGAKSISKPDITGDPVATAFVRQPHSASAVGRSASLLGSRVGSRTSTMGSARTSSLSAERAAAAKARLAERKKSGEKKKSLNNADMGT